MKEEVISFVVGLILGGLLTSFLVFGAISTDCEKLGKSYVYDWVLVCEQGK